MEFHLIPIYEPQAIMQSIKLCYEGLQRLLQPDLNETEDINTIVNGLLSGRLILWLGFLDGQFKGFVITEVLNSKELLIFALYAKDKVVQLNILTEGMNILDRYAKKIGCKRMKFYTKRGNAFEKSPKFKDWKPLQTVFYRDIPVED